MKKIESFFEVVLNTVNDAVIVIDNDFRVNFQNKILNQLYGSQVGEYCYRAYRGRTKPCENCLVLEVLKDGKSRRWITDVTLPNGDTLLIEVNSAAITDANGTITGAVEVSRDVTEQKKAEAILNKTLLDRNEILKQLSHELSDAIGYVKTVLPQPITTGPVVTDWKFIPSHSLGGDTFGYHWIDDDHFAIYLVDVSGHGWAAALLSVSVINVLRSQSLPDTDFHQPNQVLFSLNNAFPAENNNDLFFTIWYGVYHRNSHQLVYASGGHPPALLLSGARSPNRRLDQLRTPNSVMGIEPDIPYQSKIQAIDGSARLYVYSDGVYDIKKIDESIWGFNGLLEFGHQSFQVDQPNLDGLLRHVQAIALQVSFDDDFTILEVAFA
ncbi:MAG: SpoIIE family protein phosphatase [Desulfosarcinaceae bacterium]|nr:SpoIIE family protein phosphatase [Desulfosarcinaceae bacterium]